MTIISVEHIHKVYGEKTVFDDISFGVAEGEKIGVIGINGTGKSTLLRMIAGQVTPESGQIILQNNLRVVYLPQTPDFPEHLTLLEYTAGKGENAWEKEAEARQILTHLDLTVFDQPVTELSGGQRKRAALARVLMEPADVLVLDEPTNHIDNDMALWLEDRLKRFRGTLIMVTHDRYFLDRVTNRILEISHGSIYSYQAGYSRFLELKAEREAMALASERKRQSILRIEQEWASRGCRARTTRQRARLERLESLKEGKAPAAEASVEMETAVTRMGKKTVELHHLSKAYKDKVLLSDYSYMVLKGQRLGIIGPNGCGKSTLLKMIMGQVAPDSGEVVIGDTVRIGYFAQECEPIDPSVRVIDYVRDTAEYIRTRDGQISASQMLERFLFDGPMQYAPVDRLSGGERRRLYLLKVLASSPNVLILDEPTNDLDIPTLTILEDYLQNFEGIVITVSHDRYFLDTVVDRILAFEGDGRIGQYEGGYTDYLEKRLAAEAKAKDNAETPAAREESPKKNYKPAHQEKLRFSYKEQKEYESIDDDIAAIEDRLAQIVQEMSASAADFVKLQALTEEETQLKAALEEKMDRWVYLNDLAERIEKEKTGR